MIYYLFMILSVVIASISQILLKKSANKQHSSIRSEYINPFVILGYILLLVSTLLTILAYKGIAYTSGPIIESLAYILIMLLSYFILKEKITKNVIIGNIIIMLGVIVFYL